MGQSEVLELLQKQDIPLSVGEISRMLNDNYSKVSKDLNKMIQYREICFKEIDRIEAMLKYKCKRRMKLYYAKK